MSIFPNPSNNGKFELLLEELTNQLVQVYVINSIGQVVTNFNGQMEDRGELQLQMPAAGVYNVVVVLENGVVKKLNAIMP